MARHEAIRSQIREVDDKLDRLTTAYLDQALSLPEYKDARSRLIENKQALKENLAEAEAQQGNWFEPAIRFVEASKSAAFLAEEGTDEEKRDFLKKVGSNLTITNRHLSVVPRGAWQLVVDQGSFAQRHTPAPPFGAGLVGETHPGLQQRRGGDSNSRYPCGQTGFRNRRIQPLCHLSGSRKPSGPGSQRQLYVAGRPRVARTSAGATGG
jgi:hypothetical protein